MAFVFGLVLYVALVGVLDSRLPWPRKRPRDERGWAP
jgi:hypothetical protein